MVNHPNRAKCKKITSFWRVSTQTRHFMFEAYGRTQAEAEEALRAGFARHAEQYELGEDFQKLVNEIGMEATELMFGVAYRDGDSIAAIGLDPMEGDR
jgi:hypothetical protein